MRLLYVCNDFGISPDGSKGAAIHLRAITRALANLGHEVLLLSPGTGPDNEHPARRLLPPGCPPADRMSRVLRQWLENHAWDPAAARELRPLAYNAYGLEAAMAALQDAPPHAVIERLALHSCLGRDLARAFGVPCVLEVNALLTEENAQFRTLAMDALARAIEQDVLASAHAIMAVSRGLADRLAARGVARARIHVIPNGADFSFFTDFPDGAREREALALGDACVIGFAGSMKVWHGVDDLLIAFARVTKTHPRARLVLVGDGPRLAALRALATELGIAAAVTFTGAVPHARMPALLAALDVAVAPFRPLADFYFSPIKLFEYMAAGACVVATRLGQIEEVIDDGVNGLLCPPDDVDALADVLRRACDEPPMRRQLGAAARAAARRRFTWDRAARSTVRVIDRVLADQRRTLAGAARSIGGLACVETTS